MRQIGEIISIGQSKPEKRNGISKDWQAKAFLYADKLGIRLEVKDKGRWLKVFKMASLGRKATNIEVAYSYLVDHPRFVLKDSKAKLLNFFYFYENGLKKTP